MLHFGKIPKKIGEIWREFSKILAKFAKFWEKRQKIQQFYAIFNENFEITERCKGVHCVDLGESFPTSIYLQNLASIQPRTSRSKFGSQITLLITYRASCRTFFVGTISRYLQLLSEIQTDLLPTEAT